MRPVLVIVLDVVAKDCIEMTTAKNERPVEALFPDGPYPPLHDRVRSRRSHRCLDHLDAFRGEHLVEAGGELRVAVLGSRTGKTDGARRDPLRGCGHIARATARRQVIIQLADEHIILHGIVRRFFAGAVGAVDAPCHY